MILLYRRWLEARGCRVVTGSPFNLTRAPGGGVALFGVACDVLVRHYKTDWWSEREPARDDDEPFIDAEPLAAQLGLAHRRRARRPRRRHESVRRGCPAEQAHHGALVGGDRSLLAGGAGGDSRVRAVHGAPRVAGAVDAGGARRLGAQERLRLRRRRGGHRRRRRRRDLDRRARARAPRPLGRAALLLAPAATATGAAPTSASTSSAAKRRASSAACIAARPTITRRRWRLSSNAR